MMAWINGFLVAAQFLTIMPPIIKRLFTSAELGRAVGFFPLVGLPLGGLLVVANMGWAFVFPESVRLVLVLALWILMTGVIHIDGFLDTSDGLFGGFTPEKRLEIMRDEAVGAYAFTAGVLLLLLIYMSLTEISDLTTALLIAPVLGRWAMSLSLVRYPYARDSGLGRTMKDEAGDRDLVLATVTAIMLTLLIGRWLGLIAIVAVFLLVIGGARFVMKRIPGLTGDIYGLLCILAETVVLLVFVVAGNI